jgi:hypothetical protein
MDTESLVNFNLGLQVILVLAIAYSGILAKRRWLDQHCRVMRFAIAGQILSIAIVMLPQLLGLVEVLPIGTVDGKIMWTHHFLGVMVIGLWVYVNLVVSGKIAFKGRLLWVMRIAAVSYFASFFMGLYIFNQLWSWPWQ